MPGSSMGGGNGMRVIFIRHYKAKLAILLLVLVVWTAALIASNGYLNSRLIFNITINKSLSFSYPLAFEIGNIYVNEKLQDAFVETNAPLKNPLSQKMKNFTAISGNLSFNYPSAFIIDEKEFAGSDVLYHIDFYDNSRSLNGFVQVWTIPCSLEQFLESAKNLSSMEFDGFSSENIVVNGLPGFFWDYTAKNGSGMSYKGSEVFMKTGDTMYRISYFVPENLWDEEQKEIFWNIVRSFKVK